MKTTHLHLLVLVLALLSLLVMACEEDSEDEGTTDGDEDGDESDDDDNADGDDSQEDGDAETVDCTSLDEESCQANEQCYAIFSPRIPEGTQCLALVETTVEYACCLPKDEDCLLDIMPILAPDGNCWIMDSDCHPDDWVNLGRQAGSEDHWCFKAFFCTEGVPDGDGEATE